MLADRAQPTWNGASREPFKAGCADPVPDARAVAAGYAVSNPDSSSSPSSPSSSEDADLSKWHLFPPGFTGSKPASNPS